MRVQIWQPNFVPRDREPRFFVLQLGPDDAGYKHGYRFEIQVCDDELRSGAVIWFRGDEAILRVPEFSVPIDVYYAALRQLPGQGEFVNSHGEGVNEPWLLRDLSNAEDLYLMVIKRMNTFVCEDCNAEELSEHPTLGTNWNPEWYQAMAQLAREQGWMLVPVVGERESWLFEKFQILGPNCAKRSKSQ